MSASTVNMVVSMGLPPLLIKGKVDSWEGRVRVLVGVGMRKGFWMAEPREVVALAPPEAAHVLVVWPAEVPNHCLVVALSLCFLALVLV